MTQMDADEKAREAGFYLRRSAQSADHSPLNAANSVTHPVSTGRSGDSPDPPERWGILLLAIFLSLLPAYRSGRDRADLSTLPPAALHTVDVNRAPWWELTAVRHIGEVTARKIVARRDALRRAPGHAGKPFRSPADLNAVRGIGRKTVQRIAPFLRFGDSR